MHPAQSRRLKHERHEQNGEPLDVHRNGAVVGTLTLGPPQGTRQVRPWVATMVGGEILPGTRFRILDAELAVVAAAKAAESEEAEDRECLGHPTDGDGDFPHAAIGDVFYCDGRCRG